MLDISNFVIGYIADKFHRVNVQSFYFVTISYLILGIKCK